MILNIVAVATEYVNLGLHITPVPIGSKVPRLPEWPTEYPTPDMFLPSDRVGIVCGAQPDGTTLIVGDFDHKPDRGLDAQVSMQRFLDTAKTRTYWPKLFMTRSTSGNGYHIYARAWKTARKSDLYHEGVHVGELLGTGAQVVAQPPAHWIMGTPADMIPLVDDEARQFCLDLGYRAPQAPQPAPAPRTHKRPGDDFNDRGDLRVHLEAEGWMRVAQRGNEVLWRRPGKERGISATEGHFPGMFHVFSSSDAKLPAGPYTYFKALAYLKFGGNFKATAGYLRSQGYGDPIPEGDTPHQRAWLAREKDKGGRPQTADQYHLYAILQESASCKSTNITNANLIEQLGRSERTIIRWLNTLESDGWIKRRKTATGRWIDLLEDAAGGGDNNPLILTSLDPNNQYLGGCGGEPPVTSDFRQCTTCKIGEIAPDAAGVARCSYCEQAIPPVIIATEALEAFAGLRKAPRLEAATLYVRSSRPDLSIQRIQKLLERTTIELQRQRSDAKYIEKLHAMTDSTLIREVKNARSRVERATSHGQAWVFERMVGLAESEDCRRESLREVMGAYDRHSNRKRPRRTAEQSSLL
jgi:hypothetical protein